MNGRSVRTLVGLASVLALLCAAVLSTALFNGWFHSTATVTMKVQQAGLLTAPGSDVKFHGVVVGRVSTLAYDDGVAVIEMDIEPERLATIPESITASVTPTTLFGRKYIDLKPIDPSAEISRPLRAGAVIDLTESSLEVNDLFENLLGVLDRIDGDKVNETLYAAATGLQGRGGDLGELLISLDQYLSRFNGSLPTLERDIPKFARTSQTLADASPSLVKILQNVPTTQKLLSDNRSQLGIFLLSFTRFGNSGSTLLSRSEKPLRGAVDGIAPVSEVLAEYSPVYPCFFASLDHNRRVLERALGGARPGLNVAGTLLAGDPPYQYPRNLPKVSAEDAPSCYGSTPLGETSRAPGHTDFDDGSEAYRQGAPLSGAGLAAFLFGGKR